MFSNKKYVYSWHVAGSQQRIKNEKGEKQRDGMKNYYTSLC